MCSGTCTNNDAVHSEYLELYTSLSLSHWSNKLKIVHIVMSASVMSLYSCDFLSHKMAVQF